MKFLFLLLFVLSFSACADMVNIDSGGGSGGGFDSHTVVASGNAGTVITASTTNMDFTEVSDPSNAWNGTQYTAPDDGVYHFSGTVNMTSGTVRKPVAYVDGSVLRSASGLINSDVYAFGFLVKLTAGQIVTIRDSAGGTLENSDHALVVVRVSE